MQRGRRGLFVLAVVLCAGLSGSGQSPPAGGMVLVSLSSENTVVAVDVESGRITTTFPVVNGPHEIDVSPNSERAYVANAGGGPGGAPGRHVSALDLRARVTIANHALGSYDQPHDVRVARDGAVLWVACAPAKVVLEIDARSGALRREWKTPLEGGWFVAVTPAENKLYVPHLEGKGVSVIDRRNGTVRTVLTGGAQSGIDISPDGREVWIIDHERQRINIVSVDGDRIAAGIDLRSSDFGRLRFTPDGRRVVLVQGKRAALFDTAERREVAAIDMTLAGKVVAVSPASDRAIVSNPSDGRITVLALSPLRVMTSFAVGKTPDGVAWLQ